MAKKLKDLNEVAHAIIEVLKSKPERKAKSKYYPDECGIYSLSGIIFMLEDKYTSLKVSQAMCDIACCKEIEIPYVRVENYYFEDWCPYYYSLEVLNKEEAEKLAKKYSNWSKNQCAELIKIRKEQRKRVSSQTKKRKVSQK